MNLDRSINAPANIGKETHFINQTNIDTGLIGGCKLTIFPGAYVSE